MNWKHLKSSPDFVNMNEPTKRAVLEEYITKQFEPNPKYLELPQETKDKIRRNMYAETGLKLDTLGEPLFRGIKGLGMGLTTEPLRYMGATADVISEALAPIFGKDPAKFEENYLNVAADWSQKLWSKWQPREATGEYAESPENWTGYLDPKRVYGTIAEHGPFLLSFGIAASKIPMLATLLFAAMEGGNAAERMNEYERTTGEEIDLRMKATILAAVPAINAAIGMGGLRWLFKAGREPILKSKLIHIALSAPTLGTTLAIMDFNRALGEAGYLGHLPEDIAKRVIDSFYIGTVLGAPLAGISAIGYALSPGERAARAEIKTAEGELTKTPTLNYVDIGPEGRPSYVKAESKVELTPDSFKIKVKEAKAIQELRSIRWKERKFVNTVYKHIKNGMIYEDAMVAAYESFVKLGRVKPGDQARMDYYATFMAKLKDDLVLKAAEEISPPKAVGEGVVVRTAEGLENAKGYLESTLERKLSSKESEAVDVLLPDNVYSIGNVAVKRVAGKLATFEVSELPKEVEGLPFKVLSNRLDELSTRVEEKTATAGEIAEYNRLLLEHSRMLERPKEVPPEVEVTKGVVRTPSDKASKKARGEAPKKVRKEETMSISELTTELSKKKYTPKQRRALAKAIARGLEAEELAKKPDDYVPSKKDLAKFEQEQLELGKEVQDRLKAGITEKEVLEPGKVKAHPLEEFGYARDEIKRMNRDVVSELLKMHRAVRRKKPEKVEVEEKGRVPPATKEFKADVLKDFEELKKVGIDQKARIDIQWTIDEGLFKSARRRIGKILERNAKRAAFKELAKNEIREEGGLKEEKIPSTERDFDERAGRTQDANKDIKKGLEGEDITFGLGLVPFGKRRKFPSVTKLKKEANLVEDGRHPGEDLIVDANGKRISYIKPPKDIFSFTRHIRLPSAIAARFTKRAKSDVDKINAKRFENATEGIINSDLVSKTNTGYDTTFLDAVLNGLTKKQQESLRGNMEILHSGNIGRITKADRADPKSFRAGVRIDNWWEYQKKRIKAFMKNEIVMNLENPNLKDAFLEVVNTGDFDAVASKYNVRIKRLVELADKYVDVDNWGLDNYITNMELGNFKLLNEAGDTVAVGLTKNIAFEKGLEYFRSHPKENQLYIDNRFGFGNELPALLTAGQFKYISWRFAKEVKAITGDLNGKLRAKAVSKALGRVVKIIPKEKFDPFLLERKGTLEGEKNIVPLLYAYSYHLNKKLAFDPMANSIQKTASKLPPEMRKAVFEQYEAAKGKYYTGDKVIDEVLSKFNESSIIGGRSIKPMAYSRLAGKARTFTGQLKLAFRPVGMLFNIQSGLGKVWVKTGFKYVREAMELAKTEEGMRLLKENEWSLGMGQTLATEAGAMGKPWMFKKLPPWTKPAYLYQLPEPFLRKNAFLSFYLYAKNKLGLSEEVAIATAQKGVRTTQFLYTISNVPKVMRSPTGRIAGQFKTYLLNELSFIGNLNAREFLFRYLPMNLMFTGPRGLLYFLKSLPFLTAFGLLDDLDEIITTTLPKFSRGLPGFLGADVTAAGTPQLPSDWKDWLGPFISDVYKLIDYVVQPFLRGEGEIMRNVEDWATGLSPVMYYWGQLWDSVVNEDGWILGPHGEKTARVGDWWGRLVLAMGGGLSEGATNRLVTRNIRREIDVQRSTAVKVAERLTEKVSKGKYLTEDDLNDIHRYQVTSDMLETAMERRILTPFQREMLRTPMKKRLELMRRWGMEY